jgi:hypothetical protein
MNRVEQEAARYYEKDGWSVLNSGWPDFLLYRRRPDGTMEVKAAEIKNRDDHLRDNQKELLEVLSMVIPTVVAREKRMTRDELLGTEFIRRVQGGVWEFSETPITATETEAERYNRLWSEHEAAEAIKQWKSYQEWEQQHGC